MANGGSPRMKKRQKMSVGGVCVQEMLLHCYANASFSGGLFVGMFARGIAEA